MLICSMLPYAVLQRAHIHYTILFVSNCCCCMIELTNTTRLYSATVSRSRGLVVFITPSLSIENASSRSLLRSIVNVIAALGPGEDYKTKTLEYLIHAHSVTRYLTYVPISCHHLTNAYCGGQILRYGEVVDWRHQLRGIVIFIKYSDSGLQ